MKKIVVFPNSPIVMLVLPRILKRFYEVGTYPLYFLKEGDLKISGLEKNVDLVIIDMDDEISWAKAQDIINSDTKVLLYTRDDYIKRILPKKIPFIRKNVSKEYFLAKITELLEEK